MSARRFRYIVVLVITEAAMVGGQYGFAQAPAVDSATGFAPLEQWKAALLAGDATRLKGSTAPTR